MGNGYKTYRFKNKDPVIDELRTMVQGIAEVRGISEVRLRNNIANDIGMSEATLWSWFNGPTKRPQYASVKAVVRALGYELQIDSKVVNLRTRRAA